MEYFYCLANKCDNIRLYSKELNNLSGYIYLLIALLAGGLVPLAFAPLGWFWLAGVAIAILLLICHKTTAKQAWWRGYWFGVGMFGVGVSWVSISFYQFSEVALVGIIAITALFILYLALFTAVVTWFFVRYLADFSFLSLSLAFPSLWVLSEWVRGWLFTGFPWLYLGYSQIDSPLAGFAPLVGVLGVSWLVALTAVFLFYLWQRWTIIIGLTIIYVTGFYLHNIDWTQPKGDSIKVSLIQGNVHQALKWDEIDHSIRLYFALSQSELDADLIIWPETAMPLFYHEAQSLLANLHQARIEYDVDFIMGIPVQESQNTYFNAIISLSDEESFYYKHHLVPFGEYIPLAKYVGGLLNFFDVPMSEFSAGAWQQPNLRAAGQDIAASVCYESSFSEQIRQALPQAGLLVNVSNDSWFGRSLAPHQHLEIARMRALEMGRYLLRATNTGISAVINPKGELVALAPQFQQYNLRAQVKSYIGATPYVKLGQNSVILFIFGLLLISLIRIHYGHYFWFNQS
jgi:apolipoprotein N-acyltransferase